MATPQPPNRRHVIYREGIVRVERRADGDAQVPYIVGHASVFDEWTTLYEGRYYMVREIVRKGAFKRAIKEKQDVRALFNHNPNFILGRTSNKTLMLSEDDIGLATQTLPLDTPTVRDRVLAPLERGDLDGMSFSFWPRAGDRTTKETNGVTIITEGGERVTIRSEGDRRIEEVELLDVDLFDVGPVTFPQYTGTDVGLRSSFFGIDLAERIKEHDRPHRANAPLRDAVSRWLEQRSQ